MSVAFGVALRGLRDEWIETLWSVILPALLLWKACHTLLSFGLRNLWKLLAMLWQHFRAELRHNPYLALGISIFLSVVGTALAFCITVLWLAEGLQRHLEAYYLHLAARNVIVEALRFALPWALGSARHGIADVAPTTLQIANYESAVITQPSPYQILLLAAPALSVMGVRCLRGR